MISRVFNERERSEVIAAIDAFEEALRQLDRTRKTAADPRLRARAELQYERISQLLELARLGRACSTPSCRRQRSTPSRSCASCWGSSAPDAGRAGLVAVGARPDLQDPGALPQRLQHRAVPGAPACAQPRHGRGRGVHRVGRGHRGRRGQLRLARGARSRTASTGSTTTSRSASRSQAPSRTPTSTTMATSSAHSANSANSFADLTLGGQLQFGPFGVSATGDVLQYQDFNGAASPTSQSLTTLPAATLGQLGQFATGGSSLTAQVGRWKVLAGLRAAGRAARGRGRGHASSRWRCSRPGAPCSR